MTATAYWPTYLARVEDWEAQLLRPSLDIPTIVIFTGSSSECTRRIGSVTTNICTQVPLPHPTSLLSSSDDRVASVAGLV
jgi:hypothetical protein